MQVFSRGCVKIADGLLQTHYWNDSRAFPNDGGKLRGLRTRSEKEVSVRFGAAWADDDHWRTGTIASTKA